MSRFLLGFASASGLWILGLFGLWVRAMLDIGRQRRRM